MEREGGHVVGSRVDLGAMTNMTEVDTGARLPLSSPGAGAPSVSVIVPTRDRPELLRRAIASILAQRYAGPIEVIVVFDQSDPDRSLEQDWGDRRVCVIPNQFSPGLAGARNSGILSADCDFVAFCDDDDIWLPNKLAAQVALFDADPALELVTAGVLIDFNGRVSSRVLDRDRISHADLLRSRVAEAHPSTFVARREAIVDGIGLIDEDLPGSYAEDYDFLLRAARRYDVGAVTLPLAKVFWHRSSFFSGRWQTIIDALDHLQSAHPELASVPSGLARVEGQQAFAHASMGNRRDAWTKARRALKRNRSEPRAWLALAVATGAVRSEWVVRALQATGRGI
jgi:GT2 family glycosyltransferase